MRSGRRLRPVATAGAFAARVAPTSGSTKSRGAESGSVARVADAVAKASGAPDRYVRKRPSRKGGFRDAYSAGTTTPGQRRTGVPGKPGSPKPGGRLGGRATRVREVRRDHEGASR